MDIEIGQIRNFIKLFPYEQDFSKFEKLIHFTNSPDFIVELFTILRNNVKGLEKKILYLLVDEYEDMDVYQQKIINRIIKARKIAFRIASKINGVKTTEYSSGKKMDEFHDYEIIPLHFDVVKERRTAYTNLLREVFINRLKLQENYKERRPEKLLPSPSLSDEGITQSEIEKELAEIKENLKQKTINKIQSKDYEKNFRDHYTEASIFRILLKKGNEKLYAGFDEYASLSSGIVRLFILLCREAFQAAHQSNINVERGVPIDVKLQSKAAREVSRIELSITLPKNVSSVYGQKLTMFVLDLGSILRAKLHFSTQPQANRIEIIDSEKFELQEYKIPREIIESGLDLPVFLSEVSFKPRDMRYPMPKTFSLNRIFAPLLEIPPEERWRTELRAREIKELCSTETREATLRKIINEVQEKKRRTRKVKGKLQPPPNYTSLNVKKTISLVNCPVTGFGCNQNLIRHDIGDGEEEKSFLAVPFDNKTWISDPRKWIKSVMHDDFNIRCVDVTDINPSGGRILCKICSCVRQMPIGLFEITELNPNVIFELGMSTALNKLNFLLAFREKIPIAYAGNFPPKPMENIEYIPYALSRNAVSKAIKEKILPTIEEVKKKGNMTCLSQRLQCPSKAPQVVSGQVFISLPFDENEEFFGEVLKEIKACDGLTQYKIKEYRPSKTLAELCQMCDEIKKSEFCIIDTTYNDRSMLFALGVAFGKDKKFIQLHNNSLSPERPISDLKRWAIEYSNTDDLHAHLDVELKKRLEKIKP